MEIIYAMKIKEVQKILEEMAPLAYAEDFDNVGLIIGDENSEATGILVCHDALENVIEEAITKNCNSKSILTNFSTFYLFHEN